MDDENNTKKKEKQVKIDIDQYYELGNTLRDRSKSSNYEEIMLNKFVPRPK